MPRSSTSQTGAGADVFATTHWSLVLLAGKPDAPQARQALEQLCQTYWYPLYVFVRRRGHEPADAQDLTQEFFARFLEKNYLRSVSQEKGRFRSFLLGSLKHFLANEWDRARAQKRGGGQAALSLDAGSAETRYQAEPADLLTADRIYDRRWALTLLDQVLRRLEAEYVSAGKSAWFEQLKSCLTGERDKLSYLDLGRKLGMSEGAVKVAVHRLRRRYREVLRAEVAHTVGRPEQVEEELRYLFEALSY